MRLFPRDPRPALLAALALGAPALSWLSGCTYASGDSHVLVTSTPAGAEILVDGQATGSTTPRLLDLGGLFGGDHDITVRKDGYVAETRKVRHHRSWYTSRWIDGADDVTWSNPLWWTLGDWFTPFAVRWVYVPRELHVVLYAEGEGPVHADGDP